MKHGKARFDNDFGRLRALTILQRKIQTGFSNTVLAKEFNCHSSTIKLHLNKAMTNGTFERLEEEIVSRLIPKAMGALEEALTNNDAQVALEIFKGIGLLKKPSERRAIASEGEETLETYTSTILSRKLPENDPKRFAYSESPELESGPEKGGLRLAAQNSSPNSSESVFTLDGELSLAEDSPSADDTLAHPEYSDSEFDESED